MLVIWGEADLGKGPLINLIAAFAGEDRVGTLETDKLGGRFEIQRFASRHILTAGDVDADFMTRAYADRLKAITGGDPLRSEVRYEKEPPKMDGWFLPVATSNHELRVRTGVDRSAWEARLVYLHADGKPYKDKEQDPNLLRNLIRDEGAGILNHAIAGLKALLADGWQRTEIQMERVAKVLEDGRHLVRWAEESFELCRKDSDPDRPGVTTSEAWTDYVSWCERKDINAWTENTFRKEVGDIIARLFGKTKSNNLNRGELLHTGWRGMSFKGRSSEKREATFDPQSCQDEPDPSTASI